MTVNPVLILLSLSLLVGCKPARPPEPQAVHVVLCWLKKPGDRADRNILVDTSRSFLGKIPGLIDVQTGPALDTARPGADASFDVAVVFTFQNERALRAYDTNPIHQAALRDILQPRVIKITIHDFIDHFASHGGRREAKPF